jgi:hypothetical protein
MMYEKRATPNATRVTVVSAQGGKKKYVVYSQLWNPKGCV